MLVSGVKVGCQTYTWEMLGSGWTGRVTQILDWIAGAGYQGIEITNSMIGEFADRQSAFAAELDVRGLSLAAFAYARTGFTDASTWESDIGGACDAIAFLCRFPEARLALGGAAHPSRENAREKLDRAIRFYNWVGRMGAAQDVSVNVHPHSHHGSLLETAEDYDYLLSRLDPACVSFGPDTGHIVRGGQDLLDCIRTHLPRITHLHLKDACADGAWAPLGEGICDIPGVLALLDESGYTGWVVAEEESEFARENGTEAIRRNRAYLRQLGY